MRRWRAKFAEGGVEAVGSIAPGRGRKPEIPQKVIDSIVEDTLHTVPNDPAFEAKLVDVVGLYLDPPERAVVFSFDKETQCQALDREVCRHHHPQRRATRRR